MDEILFPRSGKRGHGHSSLPTSAKNNSRRFLATSPRPPRTLGQRRAQAIPRRATRPSNAPTVSYR
jgi:hypothetical protein